LSPDPESGENYFGTSGEFYFGIDRASMSDAARTYASQRFSFAEGRAKMKAAFEAVDLFGTI
jgi:hypothetical protein